MIVLLVGLNIVGIKEAAGLNIFLAVIDFATQLLLVIIGFVLIFSPTILVDNVHWGVAPTWSSFFLAIPVAMIAYTGIETISNLSEEARDPPRDIPRSIRLVAIAVFAIYFTLPLIALSALPVHKVDGEYQTLLGLPPEEGGYANDPVLGLVKNLNLHGAFEHGLEIYVGVLAATILLVATNAGVIGASRITYAMASYRQLPEVFRRLHTRFKTPWLALVVFAGIASIAVILPGQTNFLGTMYAFGAMLSFTIAHAALVALRVKEPDEELVYRARPNLRLGGIDWPLFAILGGLGTGVAWLVVVVQEPATRWAGLGWLALGFVVYVRLPQARVHAAAARDRPRARDRARARGRVPHDPRPRAAHRRVGGGARRGGAARLGAQGADRHPPRARGPARPAARRRSPRAPRRSADRSSTKRRRCSRRTRASGSSSRLERARSAGPAIVAEAARRDAEVVILGAPRTKVQGRQADLRAHRGLRAAKRADAGGRRRRQAGRVAASDGRASPLGDPDRARHRPDRAHDRRRSRRRARAASSARC